MKNISSNTELQDVIRLLEAEQAVKLKLMKEQFHVAYESLRPVNLIENTLKEISTSPSLINNLLSAAIGLATNHLLKRVITGKSNNKLRRILEIVMQFGIANIIDKTLKHKRH